VAGYELGLVPDADPVHAGNEGVIAYWGVEDIEKEFERILSMGAQKHKDIENVGGEIRVASDLDPFGNVLGIIYNPHFKLE